MATIQASCAAAFRQMEQIAEHGGEMIFAVADGRTFFAVPTTNGTFETQITSQLLEFLGVDSDVLPTCELDVTNVVSGRNVVTLFDSSILGRSVKGMHVVIEAGDSGCNRQLLDSAVACIRQLDLQEHLIAA
jgi:hypothetical protein